MSKKSEQEKPLCIILSDGTVVPGCEATDEQLSEYWQDQPEASSSGGSGRPGHGKSQRKKSRGGGKFY